MKSLLTRGVSSSRLTLALALAFALPAVAALGCGSKQAPPASGADVDTSGASSTASGAPASEPGSSMPAASAAPSASAQQKAAGDVWIGDIEAPKQFNPKPTLDGLKPKLVDCYKTALAGNASLHGRLKVRFVVEESGKVQSAEDAGSSSMKDAPLAACVFDAIKGAAFPKPGGTATVMFPLSFR